MENPVRSPMVPPIAESMSTNFAALSLVILSNVGVSKNILTYLSRVSHSYSINTISTDYFFWQKFCYTNPWLPSGTQWTFYNCNNLETVCSWHTRPPVGSQFLQSSLLEVPHTEEGTGDSLSLIRALSKCSQRIYIHEGPPGWKRLLMLSHLRH